MPKDPHQWDSGGGRQGDIKMLWLTVKVILLLLLLAFACLVTAVTYCGVLPQTDTSNHLSESSMPILQYTQNWKLYCVQSDRISEDPYSPENRSTYFNCGKHQNTAAASVLGSFKTVYMIQSFLKLVQMLSLQFLNFRFGQQCAKLK